MLISYLTLCFKRTRSVDNFVDKSVDKLLRKKLSTLFEQVINILSTGRELYQQGEFFGMQTLQFCSNCGN